jgi:cell division protein FtsQ
MATGVQEGQRRKQTASPKARQGVPKSAKTGPVGVGQGRGKLESARDVNVSAGPAIAIALGVIGVGTLAAMVTGDRPQLMAQGLHNAYVRQTVALGFTIKKVHVIGASPPSQQDILRAANLQEGAPILDLDLGAVRAGVERVGWVKQVKIIRLLPDTMVISVVERPRMAVWQDQGVTKVLDSQGKVILEANAAAFANLPLIVGAGADTAAPSLVPLVISRPRLASRLEAMVRVDQRRFSQLDRLDQTSRILELGLARLDLRDPSMLVVRPRYGAATNTVASGGA